MNKTKNKQQKTLKERYEEAKASDARPKPTAAQRFIQRCMEACKVSENTVRGWICNSRKPDKLAQEALANEFGCTAEELFATTEEGGKKK